MLCLILVGMVNPASAHSTQNDFSEVDAYIAEVMQQFQIQGISLAVVRGDQAVYMKGYGIANIQGDPVTPQTPFVLHSITKTFTALAIRQLAAAGKINVSSPLQAYLPEFRLADPSAASAITINDLLEHTSGISTLEGDQEYLARPNTTFADVLSHLSRYRPEHEAGEQFKYSNLNYILLAQVISRVTGQSYPEYMQRNIFDPLKMTHATFEDYHPIPGAASGHVIAYAIRVPYNEEHSPAQLGADNLTDTVEDMTHYLIAFINQGEYHGHSLLAAPAGEQFDTCNWRSGSFDDLTMGCSGGHVAFNSNFQVVSRAQGQVGVVVLMNTTLDTPIPGPSAYEIAYNVALITLGLPYEALSGSTYYIAWSIYIGLLLLLAVIVIRQALSLKNWGKPGLETPLIKQIFSWVIILLDLLACSGLLIVPSLFERNWEIVLSNRPDFFLPILILRYAWGCLE